MSDQPTDLLIRRSDAVLVVSFNRPKVLKAITLPMATAYADSLLAVAAYAGDREAHVREVEQFGEKLPADSYRKRNRQAIAAREARVAARLRAVERAYRTAIERDAEVTREPGQAARQADHVADHEMELE